MYSKPAQQRSAESLHTQPHISAGPAHFHTSGEGAEVPQPSLPQEDRDWGQTSSPTSTTSAQRLQPWQGKGKAWVDSPRELLLGPTPPPCS